ncbi:MAG: hypothetical protein R2855_05805 [Thermomicrobiales bacterium]
MSEIFRIEVPIELDDKGYWDRKCPDDECGRPFKVLFAHWKEKVPEAIAYCPFCRVEAEPQAFNTDELAEYVRSAALAEAQGHLDKMLGDFARSINRRRRSREMVSVSAEYKASPRLAPVPPIAADLMTLQIECESCGCQFAVIGSGFFCPACGHNSAGQTFDQTLTKARSVGKAVALIAASGGDINLIDQYQRDMLEGQIGNLVTAFQRFAEISYPRLPNFTTVPSRNAFQNLSRGDRLWTQAGGRSYTQTLDPKEWAQLQKLFQQRHLLEHQQGIVDQKYLDETGDLALKLGQRISVKESSVGRMAELLEKLAQSMRKDLGTAGASLYHPTPTNHETTAAIAGLTETDIKVLWAACRQAEAAGQDFLDGDSICQMLLTDGLSRQELDDAIEVLESKGHIEVAWVIAAGSVPAAITVTPRALRLYFQQTHPEFKQERQEIATSVVAGTTDSDTIARALELPTLLVESVLKEFASLGWISVFEPSGGEVLVSDIKVGLRRLVAQGS